MNADLVYDVGAFDGSDTAHYLDRGFRVLSIEADPTLAEKLSQRFGSEISQGRCVVLNVGVAASPGEAPFYVCDDVPLWNSFDPNHAAQQGVATRVVTVPCRPFPSILAEYDVPFFLKVDIEGRDDLCVLALQASDAPRFVSFESGTDAPRLALHLSSLGFSRFRLVDQRHGWRSVMLPAPGSVRHAAWAWRQVARLRLRRIPSLHRALTFVANAYRPQHSAAAGHAASAQFSTTSSGPMPHDVPESEWCTLSEFLYTWETCRRAGILSSSWFDVHAGR